jgi:DNA-binding transcriptional ArsR family regulator
VTSPTDDAEPPLPSELRVTAPAQLKALGHEMRMSIVTLLGQRAATVSELAEALGAPVGTVGHHLGVLEDADLVSVVRTQQVRGITAKWYRRTAATFVFDDIDADEPHAGDVDAWRRHVLPDPLPQGLTRSVSTVRFARIPDDRVEEWKQRVVELSSEFGTQELGGPHVWALSMSLYEADRPSLPDPPDASDDGSAP